MKTTLVVSAVLLIINLEAQERPFCLLNATTLPGASHTQEQLLSLPINNETPDTRFLNNWAWWGDPESSVSAKCPVGRNHHMIHIFL